MPDTRPEPADATSGDETPQAPTPTEQIAGSRWSTSPASRASA